MGIVHCANCQTHRTTGWHEEEDFLNLFNDFGYLLVAAFPNIHIVSNEFAPNRIEHFELYIRLHSNLLVQKLHLCSSITVENYPLTRTLENGNHTKIILFKKAEPLPKLTLNLKKRVLKTYDNLCLLLSLFKNYSNDLEYNQVIQLNKIDQ